MAQLSWDSGAAGSQHEGAQHRCPRADTGTRGRSPVAGR